MTKKLMAALLATAALTASLLAQTAGGFRFDGPLTRVITPNGDGLNDVAILCFDNPSDSGVSGKVYSLLGAEVADLKGPVSASGSSCPASSLGTKEQHADWDPRGQGSVASGVYVYQVKAEGATYSGTLLVVR